MKRLIVLMACIVLLAACSDSGTDSDPSAGEGRSPVPSMMAAALEELVANDHTFGSGPPPFTEYLVQSSLDPAAGTGLDAGSDRQLSADEREAIEAVLTSFGAVRWIDDAADFRTDDLQPTIEGSVILGVGEPSIDDATGLVPVSLWCGGTCGTWLTYRLDLLDGLWEVTGVEGPIAIS